MKNCIVGLGVGVLLGLLISQSWSAKAHAQEAVSAHVMATAYDRSSSQLAVQDYGPTGSSNARGIAVCYTYGSNGIFCMPPTQ